MGRMYRVGCLHPMPPENIRFGQRRPQTFVGKTIDSFRFKRFVIVGTPHIFLQILSNSEETSVSISFNGFKLASNKLRRVSTDRTRYGLYKV